MSAACQYIRRLVTRRIVARRFVIIHHTHCVAKDPFIQDFGERVRSLRLERELTQEQLAAMAGMHFSAIGHIERASRSSTLETVLKLAQALQVQPRELVPDINLQPKRRRGSRRN